MLTNDRVYSYSVLASHLIDVLCGDVKDKSKQLDTVGL